MMGEFNSCRNTLLLLLAIFLPTVVAHSQVINLKTAPVATGSQFTLFPSENLSMGGVTIAAVDSLGDPFENPAKGVRLSRGWVFSSPSFYTIKGNFGSAKSLPIGALYQNENWFGGIGMAIQEHASTPGRTSVSLNNSSATPAGALLSDKSSNNHYITALFGKRINEEWAWGGKFYYAGLQEVEGVDLLYPRAEAIEQHGYMANTRVGILRESNSGHSFEALLLYNHFNMSHDVTYNAFNGGYVADSWGAPNIQIEQNKDKTRTVGLHLGYRLPLSEYVEVGGILTTNVKWHPKIPNYELMNIPRDPGNSTAFNTGIGITYRENGVTLGMDLILQPIWSHTWANAAEQMTSQNVTIGKGEKTVDNDFNFLNSIIRTGLKFQGDLVQFSLGGSVNTINYTLQQKDFLEGTYREQDESWAEWTWSWGLGVNLTNLQIKYQGAATTGTGRPGINSNSTTGSLNLDSAYADIVLAPRGELTLIDTTVFTHQVSVIVPF